MANVLSRDANGIPISSAVRYTTSERVAISGVAALTSTVPHNLVRIVADVNCLFAYGSSPTAATATSDTRTHYLPAGLVEFPIALDGDKFSVMTATGGTGSFWISGTF